MANVRYVAVPASDIENFLQSKGFHRTTHCSEVVYIRKHSKDPRILVKVYTSIRAGEQLVRRSGADAIKVAAVYDDGRKSFGVGRFPRILRTGSTEAVLKRMLQRMRDAYARCNEWVAENPTLAMTSRLKEKAEFARLEQFREEEGFASDPDYQAHKVRMEHSFLEAEVS